jgi:hypothetical protein
MVAGSGKEIVSDPTTGAWYWPLSRDVVAIAEGAEGGSVAAEEDCTSDEDGRDSAWVEEGAAVSR